MLGDFELYLDDRRLNNFASRQARLILAYLLLNPERRYSRSNLATQFWGRLSDSRARKALNTEIWRICKALTNEGLDPDTILQRDQHAIGLRLDAECWSDVDTIQKTLNRLDTLDPRACSAVDAEAVFEAVRLYRGELLEGVYDDWCLVQREGFQVRQMNALEFLLLYDMHEQKWQSALQHGQRLLGMDPIMEHVHRIVMECHYKIGNRPAAIRQYHQCKDILRNELGVDPMPQTERLYCSLLETTPPGSGQPQKTA